MMTRGGMTSAPLTWQEVSAFSQFNNLNSFEAEMIIDMSRAFVEGLGKTDLNDKPPYKAQMTQADHAARERTIEMQMDIN